MNNGISKQTTIFAFEWFDNNLAVFYIAATYATRMNIDVSNQYIAVKWQPADE